MKKALSILSAFIFLLSSSGFSINAHYCKGKIKSVNIAFSDNIKSCCGKKKMAKDCCKNKTQVVKIKDNYIPAQIVISPLANPVSFMPAFIQLFNIQIAGMPSVESNLNYLYPPDKPISLSILYRSILI